MNKPMTTAQIVRRINKRNSITPQQLAEREAARAMLVALKACRSALDCLMGDSDLPEDDSAEMKAMQIASAAIAQAQAAGIT